MCFYWKVFSILTLLRVVYVWISCAPTSSLDLNREMTPFIHVPVESVLNIKDFLIRYLVVVRVTYQNLMSLGMLRRK